MIYIYLLFVCWRDDGLALVTTGTTREQREQRFAVLTKNLASTVCRNFRFLTKNLRRTRKDKSFLPEKTMFNFFSKIPPVGVCLISQITKIHGPKKSKISCCVAKNTIKSMVCARFHVESLINTGFHGIVISKAL